MSAEQDNADDDHALLLQQLLEICGTEDEENAREILQRCQWDVELAVHEFMNEAEGKPSLLQQHSNIPENEAADHVHVHDHDLGHQNIGTSVDPPTPIHAPPQASQENTMVKFILFPFRLVYRAIFSLFEFVRGFFFSLFPFFGEVSDPKEQLINYLSNFETQFGTTHPTFTLRSLKDALKLSRGELKFLLLHLHDEDSTESSQFCRQVLTNEVVSVLVNETCIFWSCSVQKREGLGVRRILRVRKCPFLAVLAPIGASMQSGRNAIVEKREGFISPDQFVTWLDGVISRNNYRLDEMRAEKQNRENNQLIRKEQDDAYHQSLLEDQEKERKREDTARKEKEAEMEAEMKVAALEKRADEVQQKRTFLQSSMSPEPSPDDPNAITILVKTPRGARYEHRFLSNQPVKVLHDYVFAKEESLEDFDILQAYPQKKLDLEESFAKQGINNKEALLIKDNQA